MPMYVEYRNTKGESVKPSLLDDLICARYNVTPDKDYYFEHWYDTIAWRSFSGNSLEIIADELEKDEANKLADIARYIAEMGYKIYAWRG